MTNRDLAMRREFDSLMNSTFEDLWNNVFHMFDFGNDRLTITNKGYPKVNVQNQKDKILIEAAIPGLTKEDIAVEYSDGTLTISGKSQNSKENNTNGYVARELHRSTFARGFRLNEQEYDVEKISAGVDKGLLSVIIPKRTVEEKKPEVKKIEVK